LGRLLSLARFSFIKAFPIRFDDHIIAELRGYLDESGHCPFWEAVGNKFFQKDYYTMDVLSGIGEKDFIEALLPEFPIYVSLLPQRARECIGKVHPNTEPARRILLEEGFQLTQEVDIFDAGPIVRARREDLRTWQALRKVKVMENGSPPADVSPALLTNCLLDFRATLAEAEILPDGMLRISRDVMELLDVRDDGEVHFMPLKGIAFP